MLSIAAARLLLCCQAHWPCERLCILICLSTAVSEPRGYAWSSHSHYLSFWGDGSALLVAYNILYFQATPFFSFFSALLGIATVAALAAMADLIISCWQCTDTAIIDLFLLCSIQGYLCHEWDLCSPVVFSFVQVLQLPLTVSIFTTVHPTFGLSWHQIFLFWILCQSNTICRFNHCSLLANSDLCM